MPQYARRVEVEDLDKNFWVIGVTLDCIVNALWGRNNSVIDDNYIEKYKNYSDKLILKLQDLFFLRSSLR